MPTLRERLREAADKLRIIGGPTDALDKTVTAAVDRATSELMINPDWGVNMELVDIINSEPNDSCYEKVFRAIRRRLLKTNPKIQLLSLTLLETCVKNTGTEFHGALVVSEFWEEVLRLADPRKKADLQVADKIIVLVEDCSHALQPAGYKTAYNTLKSWGVHFPTRDKEEIGAGFNLPPPTVVPPNPTVQQPVNIAGDVSEEDQRAIQEALRDLSSQPPPPPPPPTTTPTPTVVQQVEMANERSLEKMKADLLVVGNSIEVLKEALASISKNEPELILQDYITDIRQQCVDITPKLKQFIAMTDDETVLADALYLNDELRATLEQYDRVADHARTGAIGVIDEEPELLTFEDEQPQSVANPSSSYAPPPPAFASAASSSTSVMLNTGHEMQQDDFAQLARGQKPANVITESKDPFEELASQTPTGTPAAVTPPAGAHHRGFGAPSVPSPPQPAKKKDPFEDLITL